MKPNPDLQCHITLFLALVNTAHATRRKPPSVVTHLTERHKAKQALHGLSLADESTGEDF